MSLLEIAANLLAGASILLAGRNSVHTWWTGIVGCGLFALVFLDSRLYADAVPQAFFVITSIVGLMRWCPAKGRESIDRFALDGSIQPFDWKAFFLRIAQRYRVLWGDSLAFVA
ncbi:nicotinamide mononucleotide transporter [Rhodanobacter geophilus]|uniref:Nicotinamide mononucleotide transporter n=1 Tax=Rhodanobacter geophilus TaxID=3162488 RepID=A0ABV3QR76_9GAMM